MNSYHMRTVMNDTDSLNMNSGRMRIFRWLFTPVLAPLLENRRIVLILVGAAVIQVWLTALGLPGWRCPIMADRLGTAWLEVPYQGIAGHTMPGLRFEQGDGIVDPGGVAVCHVDACFRTCLFGWICPDGGCQSDS